MNMAPSKNTGYSHLNPQYFKETKPRLLKRDMGFVWFVIVSVFVVSAFLETRAGEQFNNLTPEICSHYLAGPAPAVPQSPYSTYGMGLNPAPANLPATQTAPRIGFEIAPQLPNHAFLPPRGVAGWVDVDPATGQTLINGQPVGSQTATQHDKIVDACLEMMSQDPLK